MTTNQLFHQKDYSRLRSPCDRFYAHLEHNRKGYNDGNMARLIWDDVQLRGEPSAKNKRRLLNWCYTNGNVFQKGVPLAREICIAIYGRLLPDPDKE